MIFHFSVEGNIGSGKSTFIKYLQNNFKKIYGYEIIYLLEPVSEWESIKDENNTNIIEKYYKDNKKYAFSFQMMAYISRLVQFKNAVNTHSNAIIITERSIYCDRNVFAKMLYDDGKIEKVNYDIYLKWFDAFANEFNFNGIIYINTSTDVCDKRIKLRNRSGETIPLEYLNKCKLYHDKFCYKFKNLTLNGNRHKTNDLYDIWIKSIKTFIIDTCKISAMDNFPTMNDLMEHPFF
jgi:deoxyadenosine/deoxycytidine kinase